jgi:hypothetical protein
VSAEKGRNLWCDFSLPFEAGGDRDNLPGREWLYIRRFRDGKLKFFFSNAPADMPKEELHRAATLRWPIEQCLHIQEIN